MPTLDDQLKLEQGLVDSGIERYFSVLQKSEESGKTGFTGYSTTLLSSLVVPVSDEIRKFLSEAKATKFGKYRSTIELLNPTVIAYIGLRTVLNYLGAKNSLSGLTLKIGQHIEDEVKYKEFKKFNPEYFNTVMNDLDRKNTKSYRHMRSVLSVTSAKKDFTWVDWDITTKAKVGAFVLECIRTTSDMVDIVSSKEGKHKVYYVVPSQSCIEWIEKYNTHKSVLSPHNKPCIIAPDDWSGMYNGGYWSEAMRQRTPFIKNLDKKARKLVNTLDLRVAMDAVNRIQATEWTINTPVLDVMRTAWSSDITVLLPSKYPIEIPKFRVETKPKDMDDETLKEFKLWKTTVSKLYTDNISRASKAYEISRTLACAQEYTEHESLWFVYQCDFRSRVYCSSTVLSPQGADYSKALLHFKNKVKLGDTGMYWLEVHGANCYGVDKVSFDARVQWVRDNKEQILRMSQEPLSCLDFWSEADKPWQFLAFVFEYVKALEDPTNFESSLPVGMDGSCNGLQHFSAMSRDEIGGFATNLLNAPVPQDIYQIVADKARELILDSPSEAHRARWMSFMDRHGATLPRSITKRCVMTLPYGSTKYSCFDFVYEAVHELEPEFLKEQGNELCSYLTEFIWEAISCVVVQGRKTMDWLQHIVGLLAESDMPIYWITPTGFPVYQDYTTSNRVRIRTTLMGSFVLSARESTGKVCKRKQMYGISPNFVHSLDASHMMFTVLEAHNKGIREFAMIHDDFGTHAGNIALFRDVIKDTFVDMYTRHDPLKDMKSTAGILIPDKVLEDIPKCGNLILNQVLSSEYFFS